jgi:stearoyl-CoA desaturase (delta-9 desaturase)
MRRIPWKLVHWPNSLFLMGTLLLLLVAVPAYLLQRGLDWFHAALFLWFFAATGLSITLGYHRLFAHGAFQAAWPARLFTLVFGAAAFENSALCWAASHRKHHKFVDSEEDPYDIGQGFLHAHIGWVLFKLKPDASLDYVKDLQLDPLVRWQHRHYRAIAILAGFVLPALAGAVWDGWAGAVGGFLIAGVARVVVVQHLTFCINSLCHTLGRQPYSSRCTARDSAIMAVLTFGEGYHNFHHAFQHDYRNGVKPWQFDPTKWCIWLLEKLRLAWRLRRVPEEKILLAQTVEQERQLAARLHSSPAPFAESLRVRLQAAQHGLQEAFGHWERRRAAYAQALESRLEASQERLTALRRDVRVAADRFRAALRDWQEAHRLAQVQLA